MSVHHAVLRDRRVGLLRGIGASDLYRMRAKIEGPYPAADGINATMVRERILANWDAYADEIRTWVEFTITGESTL